MKGLIFAPEEGKRGNVPFSSDEEKKTPKEILLNSGSASKMGISLLN